jgi:hypothetical protein
MAAMMSSAPIAQAESTSAKFTLDFGAYPENFTGTNVVGSEVLTMEAGNVECASSFEAHESESSQQWSFHPSYSSCKAFGFLSATVNTEFCDFKYKVTTKTAFDAYQGHVDVVCSPSSTIKITAGTCKAEIKAQTGLTTVNFEDETFPALNELKILANISGIAYTVTQDGFGCPFGGTGNKTAATYKTKAEAPLVIGSFSGIHIG